MIDLTHFIDLLNYLDYGVHTYGQVSIFHTLGN